MSGMLFFIYDFCQLPPVKIIIYLSRYLYYYIRNVDYSKDRKQQLKWLRGKNREEKEHLEDNRR